MTSNGYHFDHRTSVLVVRISTTTITTAAVTCMIPNVTKTDCDALASVGGGWRKGMYDSTNATEAVMVNVRFGRVE